MFEGVQILPVEGCILANAQGRLNDVIPQPKERLGWLLHTRVLRSEAGHEDGLFARRVPFRVNGSLWKDGHFEFVERVYDATSAVFEREFSRKLVLDDNIDLGGAGVHMWRVDAARADKAQGHGDAGADESWEELAVRLDGATTYWREDMSVAVWMTTYEF